MHSSSTTQYFQTSKHFSSTMWQSQINAFQLHHMVDLNNCILALPPGRSRYLHSSSITWQTQIFAFQLYHLVDLHIYILALLPGRARSMPCVVRCQLFHHIYINAVKLSHIIFLHFKSFQLYHVVELDQYILAPPHGRHRNLHSSSTTWQTWIFAFQHYHLVELDKYILSPPHGRPRYLISSSTTQQTQIFAFQLYHLVDLDICILALSPGRNRSIHSSSSTW